MKKYLGFVVVASLLFSFSLALAEDNGSGRDGDNSSKREDFRERVKADQEKFRESFKSERESFSAEVKMRREEFKSASLDKRREFWNKAKEMFSRRFDVAVTNLEKIQVRVGDLIVKMNAENKDTAAATDFLNASKQKLSEAKAKLAEIKALLPAAGEQVTPEIFEKIKLGAREAKNLLKEAHHDLISAVRELKSLKDDDNTSEDKDN